jgi:outer membrane lipoprotein SlyB
MSKQITRLAFATAVLYALSASAGLAQSSGRYDQCVTWAQQQTGYYGDTPNERKNAPLKGAAAGAAGGAFLGGITGGSAGTGAAIGAAFGAIAGGVRKGQAQSAQQNQANRFYGDVNACLNAPPH